MRRCPHCQSPSPERAAFCSACGRALPPPLRAPGFRREDLWQPLALRRALQALAPLLAFRLSAGSLLTAGPVRVEGRFLAFHLMHGILLAGGVAWVRGLRRPQACLRWLGAGLLGGLLAESLEAWYTYRHLMGRLTLFAWDWFGLGSQSSLIYQVLQGLRILGVGLPLLALALSGEKRVFLYFSAVFLFCAAVALRIPVRGAYLSWAGLAAFLGLSWAHLLLYSASALCLLYGLGQRALTPEAQEP